MLVANERWVKQVYHRQFCNAWESRRWINPVKWSNIGKYSITIAWDSLADFDILFKDATPAVVDFTLKYVPNKKGIAQFLDENGAIVSDPDASIEVYLVQHVRTMVRDFILESSKEDLNDSVIFEQVELIIKSNEISSIIEISDYVPKSIEYWSTLYYVK